MTEVEVPRRSIVAAHVLSNSGGVREADTPGWVRQIADPMIAADYENMASVFEGIARTASSETGRSIWLAAVHLLRMRVQECHGGDQ